MPFQPYEKHFKHCAHKYNIRQSDVEKLNQKVRRWFYSHEMLLIHIQCNCMYIQTWNTLNYKLKFHVLDLRYEYKTTKISFLHLRTIGNNHFKINIFIFFIFLLILYISRLKSTFYHIETDSSRWCIKIGWIMTWSRKWLKKNVQIANSKRLLGKSLTSVKSMESVHKICHRIT